MNNEYLLVHKSILPEYYEVVITARKLINEEKMSVSEACKKTGISRSTFYKYKDYVFKPMSNIGHKAILAFQSSNEKGILSNILARIASFSGNIVSINQDTPIDGSAYITIAIDVSELTTSINELVEELKKVPFVKNIELLALE